MSWKYFINPNHGKGPIYNWRNNGILIASKDNTGGYFINKDGRPIDGIEKFSYFPLNGLLGNTTYKEVNIKETFKLFKPEGKKNLSSLLGITYNEEPIVITEENKNLIISILKDARAFNGDSAHDFRETPIYEICQELADQKIIKTLDYNKFWIEEENKIEVKEEIKQLYKLTPKEKRAKWWKDHMDRMDMERKISPNLQNV